MSTAEIAINESQLNQRIIKALRKEYWIVELVDEWILIPQSDFSRRARESGPSVKKTSTSGATKNAMAWI